MILFLKLILKFTHYILCIIAPVLMLVYMPGTEFLFHNCLFNGFGGLGVACWPSVPKFAGSNPAEAVGFLGQKNPQHAFLRRGSKAVGPMS